MTQCRDSLIAQNVDLRGALPDEFDGKDLNIAIPRALRELEANLAEARAELHARPLAPEREPRADAEHRAREFQHEHARPVHLHLAREDALDLRDARAGRHRLRLEDAVDDIANAREREQPERRKLPRRLREPRVEPRQDLLRAYEQIAERRHDEPREHADEISLEEQSELQPLRLREPREEGKELFTQSKHPFHRKC